MSLREGKVPGFFGAVSNWCRPRSAKSPFALLLAAFAGRKSHQPAVAHPYPPIWADASEVDESKAAQYLRGLELRLREFVGETGKRAVRFAVTEAANHGHGIAEYARRVYANLVVLGTKGRSNLGYVLLGSTVERLLREIPCSALVVRPAVPAEG